MPTHDLENECTGMTEGSRIDVVNGFADTLESCRSANSQVGHGHVVINGTDEADNLEVCVLARLLLSDLARGEQLVHEPWPLCAEDICTGERAITTTHDECIDTLLDHVVSRSKPPLGSPEGLGPCSSDDRSALAHE